jgi:ubiquinone/menaquinone biosynthesis C-methylase UbiE
LKVKYDNHHQEMAWLVSNPKQLAHARTWLADDRVDSWRHRRMREEILPLIRAAKDKKWLTVGDGRYGTDAHYLISEGIKDVHASDMVDTLLKIGSQEGFIKGYSAQNAERLSFADEQFDYVYCKESYHHFPRPYVALYEMLRVCKEAVVLNAEPNDQIAPRSFRQSLGISLMETIRKMLGRQVEHHGFESVGNYVYSISELEMKKLMLGIGLRYCAFKGINDRYVAGVEEALMTGGTPEHRKIKNLVQRGIRRDDLFCSLGLKKPSLITAIVFKNKPDDGLWQELGRAGFERDILPENPYATWSDPPAESDQS